MVPVPCDKAKKMFNIIYNRTLGYKHVKNIS